MSSLRVTIRPRVSDDEISARKTGAFPIRRRINEERMLSRELAGYIVVEPHDTTDYEGFTAADRLLGAPGPRPTALFVGNALAALGALTLAPPAESQSRESGPSHHRRHHSLRAARPSP